MELDSQEGDRIMEEEVNNSIFEPNRGEGYNRITFRSKEFFKETLRLSKDPILIKETEGEVHPISRFVPTNYPDLTKHSKFLKFYTHLHSLVYSRHSSSLC